MFELLNLMACFGSDGAFAVIPPRHEAPAGGGEGGGDGVEHAPRSLSGSYFVPWPEPAEPDPPTGDGDRLYARGVVHDMRITLSEDALDSLRRAPTTEVPGDLRWEDEEMRVAVRLKGTSSFRSIDQKPSFKIDVHGIHAAQRIDGEKRLTLQNLVQDQTMVRESTYYWLAARMGVPAPRFGYTRVWVNDQLYGLYGLLETMDEELIEHAFPNADEGGNLYEASGADFTEARDWFDLEESGDIVPTPDDIEDLVDAVEDAGEDGFWPMLGDRFALDATLSYWAVDTATGNDDGYVFNRHNYLTYNAPTAARWYFLPWGTDRSFSREVPPRGDGTTPLMGALVIRCWRDHACTDALSGRLLEVLDVWETELPSELEATIDLVADACDEDPRKEYRCKPDHIREFVEERADYLRSAL